MSDLERLIMKSGDPRSPSITQSVCPVPDGNGFVRLDGAETLFQHYIDISEESSLKIGAWVEAVFFDQLKGMITDIMHFRTID